MIDKFKIILIFLIIFVCMSIPSLAEQILYNTFYFIDGKISPPTNDATVSVNNRVVLFYLTTTESGYASDISGQNGNSGQDGNFIINAMSDVRMILSTEVYKITVVKGSDGYGVNPKDLGVSGKGFDTSKDLVLVFGEGIEMPGTHPFTPPTASAIPIVKNIWFNNRIYQKNLVAKKYEFVVSEQPKVDVKITSGDTGIDTSSLSIILDEGTANETIYKISESNITNKIMGTTLPIEVDYTYDFSKEGKTLSSSDHQLKFTASNSAGTTFETTTVKVATGLYVIGIPLTYPSPLHLKTDAQVILEYGLSKDANIDIYIFDITGEIVKKISCNAGTSGGSVGGTANPNKVTWDLSSDKGYKIGSGIYVWTIVDRANSKVIGRGKLTTAP